MTPTPPTPVLFDAPVKSAPKLTESAVASSAVLPFHITSVTTRFDHLNMIIYGTAGAGKTTLAATAADVPEMSDVLLLDIEAGSLTIQNNKRVKHKEKIDKVRISSYKQLAEVHKFLQAHCRLRDDLSAEGILKLRKLQAKFTQVNEADIQEPRRYRTVIIDSLSELDQLCLYELMGLSTDMDLKEAMNDGEVDVAQFAEFRKNNQIMQLITRAYRDLPINALMTCHAAYIQDEQKRMFFSPSLTGKLKGQIQGFVDLVGYLQVGSLLEGKQEAPRRMYLQPVGKFDAKSRLAGFNVSYLDNPFMNDVWNELLKVSKA